MPSSAHKLKERKKAKLKSSLKHAVVTSGGGKSMLPGLGFGLQITLCGCGRRWEGVSPPGGPSPDFKPLR